MSTLGLLLAMALLRGYDEVVNSFVPLLVSAVGSLAITPTLRWVAFFASAFHLVLREKDVRLERDHSELTGTVADLTDALAACREPGAETQAAPGTGAVSFRGFPPGVVFAPPAIQSIREEGARRLADAREQAIHNLLNREVTDANGLAALKRDISEWERNVVALLEQYGTVVDVTAFRVLGAYEARATGGINAEHNRELAMLWERLERLLNTIKALSRHETG